MMNPDILAALEPVIKVFEKLNISYLIGGSLASSAYGTARSTLDIDLVVNLQSGDVPELVNGLKSGYYIDGDMVMDAIQQGASFNIIHLSTMIKIDFFVLQNGSYDMESFRRKRKDTFQDGAEKPEFYFASPEDIILKKLDWYRKGGEVSERQWYDILGVLKVQGNNLDFKYLNYWANELGCTDLLLRAVDESKK